MVEKRVRINNERGIHTRPSVAIVQLTERYACRVKLRNNDIEVDGKSIMGILMLEAIEGTYINITCDGPDEQECCDRLAELISSEFDDVYK